MRHELLVSGPRGAAGPTDHKTTRMPTADLNDAVLADWTNGVLRLVRLLCLRGVSAARWDRLQMDAAVFLETWGAQAAALDWTAHDLFGANRTKAIERVDLAGLVVLINGRELVAITDSEAVISTRTGVSLTHRRKWIEPVPGQTLLWKLGDEALADPLYQLRQPAQETPALRSRT